MLSLAAEDRNRIDAGWETWLAENLARQCDVYELATILLGHGLPLEWIRLQMGERYPMDMPNHRSLSEVRITRVTKDPRLKQIPTRKLQIYRLKDFLSVHECKALVEIIENTLRPSAITLEAPGSRYRTSCTSDLSLVRNPLVETIDHRIAETLGINTACSEGIQAQRYDRGQEFKAHTDYFEPGTDEYRGHAAQQGNRTWTFMVYLNDDLQGGSTKFHAIDREFRPKAGSALVWNNLFTSGAPNPNTLHSGLPVSEGRKVIITKWFRERASNVTASATRL